MSTARAAGIFTLFFRRWEIPFAGLTPYYAIFGLGLLTDRFSPNTFVSFYALTSAAFRIKFIGPFGTHSVDNTIDNAIFIAYHWNTSVDFASTRRRDFF